MIEVDWFAALYRAAYQVLTRDLAAPGASPLRVARADDHTVSTPDSAGQRVLISEDGDR